MSTSSDSDYIVKCVTCHTTPIKTLIEALNGILSDVSLIFKPDGIYVMTMNRLETIYVDLFLMLQSLRTLMDMSLIALIILLPVFALQVLIRLPKHLLKTQLLHYLYIRMHLMYLV